MWWTCGGFISCGSASQRAPKWDCISRVETAVNQLLLWKTPHDLCFPGAEGGIMTLCRHYGEFQMGAWNKLVQSLGKGQAMQIHLYSFPPLPLCASHPRVARQSGERLLFLPNLRYLSNVLLKKMLPPLRPTYNLILQTECSTKSMRFISHVYLDKSPKVTFRKRKPD